MAHALALSYQDAASPSDAAAPPAAVAAADARDLAIAVARTRAELRAVEALLETLYEARGYLLARAPPDPASDVVLMALADGEPIGTLTVRFDGPSGLRADETFPEHLEAVRAQGRRLCELGRLAVARGNVRSTGPLTALFARAHDLVRERPEVTDVFIEVNPRHVAFYRHGFGFAVAADERACPRVRAPAVLLRLDVATFLERPA